jgi:hypothetical protein
MYANERQGLHFLKKNVGPAPGMFFQQKLSPPYLRSKAGQMVTQTDQTWENGSFFSPFCFILDAISKKG